MLEMIRVDLSIFSAPIFVFQIGMPSVATLIGVIALTLLLKLI